MGDILDDLDEIMKSASEAGYDSKVIGVHKARKINIEELLATKPDYVLDKFMEWYNSIPKDERDKPMTGIFVKSVYTPRDVHDEINHFMIVKNSTKMSHLVSKDLLKEIVKDTSWAIVKFFKKGEK